MTRKLREPLVPAEERTSSGEPRVTRRGKQPNGALIAEVRQLWADDVTPREATRRLAEKYGVTPDTVGDYWRRVREENRLHDETELDDARAQKITRLKAIGAQAAEMGDWAAALKAEDMQIKLLGLNAAKKLDVTVTSGVLVVGGGPSEDNTAEKWAAAHSVTTTLGKEKT
jgi:hypothetical protein